MCFLTFFVFIPKSSLFRQKGRKKLIKLKRMCVTHNWIKVVGIKLTVIFFFLKITQFFSQTKTNLCDGSNSCYMFKMTLLLLGLNEKDKLCSNLASFFNRFLIITICFYRSAKILKKKMHHYGYDFSHHVSIFTYYWFTHLI